MLPGSIWVDDAVSASAARGLIFVDVEVVENHMESRSGKAPTTSLRQSKIVELRFFGGLTVEQTAAVLGISEKTVKRDWSMAKAWLHGDLKVSHGDIAE
jgi:DNA-binding NarL/FixJ family response regulator